MSFEKDDLTLTARVMVEELRRMAETREEYIHFACLAGPVRYIWRRAAWLMEELIATIEASQKKK